MKFHKILITAVIVTALISCQQQMPVTSEGNARAKIVVIGDTTVVGNTPVYIPLKNAKVILSSEYGISIRYTDSEGILILEGIPSSTYSISARLTHPKYSNILLVGSLNNKEIISGKVLEDTIKAVQVANTGIAINEIYACGPLNNIYFMYDLYFELYNYSEEVKYLDGMTFMRFSGNSPSDGKKGPGADEGDDGDIDGVTYMFKFPGKPGEKNHPFYPKTFQVLATTAINHKKSVATSIDLSKADWEFYNQFSVADFDNPQVPNLINTRSDRTADFLVGLTSDVLVLASGTDLVWEDGIDISSVIDGVQYVSSTTSRKYLDTRVDKSVLLGAPKYSGKSMQRREPGGDSNDAMSDWEILNAPTPGKQK
ncbi:MAG: hypothetical protein A2499_02575 [Stygiobacter sp. RIFOXYC12_FULL_38_8]|nr:MAG: hypothetical protein A2X62_11240 [Stygiobacter sp. GWC2_38_9]OGU80540.1 MAG: hypothetical protein A2279_04675 [Stygiobacter sp. RIFOXYA12_FULL_38_9]OGV06959.1 MAG: hypothetical protein A2299_16490 [Stygiobacter sp. RIFOXYB2_FULL_37_11]OGV12172.1 MAG: hypothetical protein A2237_02790 [Stygiobacter sp. RIFOXYA2_FULL_38_8]OGV15916.1 MAG: hypothetical protein A2440_02995 [Stygiobacter sp. RIFOXYC2_FULL_38_25]OGV26552.1 MAG: hypothetical protein A2499_02575 [Stygiobacter sp. RIFOXYC12_FULL_